LIPKTRVQTQATGISTNNSKGKLSLYPKL